VAEAKNRCGIMPTGIRLNPPASTYSLRMPNKKKLTAKTPRTPSFLSLKIAFLGDLGALAVQNHIHFVRDS
jgi:hypothetical protein